MALPPNEGYRNPDGPMQPTLLTPEKLAELECLSASRPRKGEIRGRKERPQDVNERVTHRGGATQPRLPGF